MKKMRFLFAVMLTTAWVGCSQEDSLQPTKVVPSAYTGSMEKMASRVWLDPDHNVNWEMDDSLTIFPQFDINNKYKVTDISNEGLATFDWIDFIDKSDYSELTHTYAVYPYYDETDLEGEFITTFLPSEVEYTGMRNSIKHALMSAKSPTDRLHFTNAQGILRLKLNAYTPFYHGAIASIRLESASKLLSGTATIDYSESDTPSAEIAAGGKNYLQINIAEEYQEELPARKNDEWAYFYIPVVPADFPKNDLTLTITWKKGGTYQRSVGVDVKIERKKYYTLSHTIGDVPVFEGDLDNMEEIPGENTFYTFMRYTGQVESVNSRATLDDNYCVNWEINDPLSIFPGTDNNHLYKVDQINDSKASFLFVSSDSQESNEIDAHYAVYPYHPTSSISDGIIKTQFPAEIEYSGMENSIRHALMTAKAESNNFTFTNAMGILRLKLNAEQPFKIGKVKTIQLKSKTKGLCGEVTVDYSGSNQAPAATIFATEDNRTLTLNLIESQQKDLKRADANKNYTEFYIPMVPGTFDEKDLLLTVKGSTDTYSQYVNCQVDIERRKIFTLTHTITASSYDADIEN